MTSPTVRGPLPPSVYWRRRVILVGVTLAFLLIVVNLVRGPGGAAPSDGADGTARTASGTTTSGATSDGGTSAGAKIAHKAKRQAKKDAAAAAAAEAGTTGTDPGTGGAPVVVPTGPPQGPTAPVLVEPTGDCSDRDVVVTPAVADATVGEAVPITLTLRTKVAAACTWHVSANHLAVKISRFGNEIWSSRICPQQVPTTDVVVRQAVTSTLALSWTSRREESGCPRLTQWANPGHYRIAAAALGGPPAGAGFHMSPRVIVSAPPVTPDPSTTSGQKKDGQKKGGQKKDGHQGTPGPRRSGARSTQT